MHAWPAYHIRGRSAASPIVLSVPHAGRAYPASIIQNLRNPANASLRLEDRYVDRVATYVAAETGAPLLLANAPRAVIDLNRAPNEMDWSMVKGEAARGFRSGSPPSRRVQSGLGLVPRRLAGMGELWRQPLVKGEVEARLSGIHRPYHIALERLIRAARQGWGTALLLDIHSMPPLGPKSGPDAAPDFVLGDRFGGACDARLSTLAAEFLSAAGWRVTHNRPYAGGYVLDRHSAPSSAIHALQIEICRSTYLDEDMSEPGSGLPLIARCLASMVRMLEDELAGWSEAQAAE
ncbi:N-formylglutamate amidohydrolase [Altererythrobacter endophyticus]|uniref:N-formylglutamate amidohydrolase n=2 Tax=Altericroceibacterium endophyticum TaxID=1808508 RepID=A0A6I4T2N6_9SPHN|nr:N-formylglutamate amidohydrolase [Altericroceibacterium endophyticum]